MSEFGAWREWFDDSGLCLNNLCYNIKSSEFCCMENKQKIAQVGSDSLYISGADNWLTFNKIHSDLSK